MPEDSEGRRLLETLRGELEENRRLMETVHADLQRERQEPPAWLAGVMRRIENLERDVYGNGKDGIKTLVTRLEQMLEHQNRVPAKEDGEVSVKVLVAIVAGIATVVTALINGIFMLATNGG